MARAHASDDVMITASNYEGQAAKQRRRAASIAAETRARGVVILTSLTPEQREADRLEELRDWPARWAR
jgi:hypothetical protein